MRSHLALRDALRTGRRSTTSRRATTGRSSASRAPCSTSRRRAPRDRGRRRPPPPGGRLLDVGGAPGTYARAFAAAGWEVTVLDLPGPLDVAGEGLRAAGVRVVAGDAAAALPDGPWDAVYLGNLVHLFDPDAAGALVARAEAALRPGGLLAVQEVLDGLVTTQGRGSA